MYRAGELVISAQVFGGGHLGVWAQEVGREMLVSPVKGIKIRRYFICCGIILKIKDKKIFYLL